MAEERVVCTLEIEADGKNRTLTTDERVISFGRSRKNTVPIRDDSKISSQHCQIVRQKDAWTVIDCGSKNKTFLNGAAVSVAALRDGDRIKIGKTTVTFRNGEPKAVAPGEAEKMLAVKPSSAVIAGEQIAAALAAKKDEPPAAPARPSKKPNGVRDAVRIERGAPGGVSMFAMACFLVAGVLSGLTTLFVVAPKDKKSPQPVAKNEQKFEVAAQPVVENGEPLIQKIGIPDPPPAEEKKEEVALTGRDLADVMKEGEDKEAPVAMKTPEEPREEPAKPEPKPEDVAVKEDAPPAASDDPPTGEEVAAADPKEDKKDEAPLPGGDTAAEPAVEPTQFMGLKARQRYIVFMMDVTGSMEDPATYTPLVISGPPGIKMGAEVRRQLDKFSLKDIRTKLDAAKYELANAIAWLHPDVEFSVIFYSFQPTPWQKKLVVANDKNKVEAIKRVKTASAWGGTNIFDSLEMGFTICDDHKKALKKPVAPAPGKGSETSKATYSFFLVTDGKHNTGRYPDPEEFLREIRKLNSDDRVAILTIGVGKPGEGVDPPDPAFLNRLAEENGGECRMMR